MIDYFGRATDTSLYQNPSPFQTMSLSAAMMHDGLRGAGRGKLHPTQALPQQDTIAAGISVVVCGLPNVGACEQFEDILEKRSQSGETATSIRADETNLTAVANQLSVEKICCSQRSKNKKTPISKRRIGSNSNESRVYIDEVREDDILCGRGGRSNHHHGNKRYRQVVNEMKMKYKSTEGKLAKTDLSNTIVDYVYAYGGRFIKKDEKINGQYYLLTANESRRKTSQALREAKDIKWTA